MLPNGQSASRRVMEFLDFRLDFGARTLTRNGTTVVLTPKIFDTLRLLVERQGQVVTKEEFLTTIWPNTSVEESNLTQNIFTIRKLLGEKESGRKIIETRSGLGYVFLPEVRSEAQAELVAATSDTAAPAKPSDREQGRYRGSWLHIAVLIFLLLAASGVVIRVLIPQISQQSEPTRWALGSRAGWENFPALAPDGSRVAFVWDGGRPEATAQLYVQNVPGAGTSMPTARGITAGPGSVVCPVWSPDGQHIAFVRVTSDASSLHLIRPDGTGERKLRDLRAATSTYTGCPASFSADGHFMALAAPGDLWAADLRRIAVEGGAEDGLAVPDAGDGKAYHNPVYSPDGRYLALLHFYNRGSTDVVIVPTRPDGTINGQPRHLTNDRLPIHGLAWTPDSLSIVYSATRNGSDALWRISLDGGVPQRTQGGDQGQYPSISARGGKLAFAILNENRSLWRIPLTDDGAMAEPPSMLTASTRRDEGPVYSPDGRKLSFFSDRTGSYEVWVCDADGGHPRALTAFAGAFAGLSDWSPDGRTLVFDVVTARGKHDIFTIPAAGGQARMVIEGPDLDVVPTWSRDGRYIYFPTEAAGSRFGALIATAKTRCRSRREAAGMHVKPRTATSTIPRVRDP